MPTNLEVTRDTLEKAADACAAKGNYHGEDTLRQACGILLLTPQKIPHGNETAKEIPVTANCKRHIRRNR